MPSDELEPYEPLRYSDTRTLIYDLARERQIAFIEAPVSLPDGAVIQLGNPNRDALVLSTRLELGPGDAALLIVNVVDPGEEGETVPRHPVDRM